MNNLTGISYASNIASLDGLSIIQADALYIDGIDIDGAAYVKKAGDSMSGTLNMGTNPVKTSYAPLVGQDVANKAYVDSAISGGGFVPYTGATSNVNLNTKSISAGDLLISGNSYLGSGSATNYVSIVGPTTMEKESDINQKPDSTDHVLVLRSTTAPTTTAPTLVVDTDYVHNVCSIQAKAYNNSAVLPLLLQYGGGETIIGGTITHSTATANRVAIYNASKALTSSAVTSSELGYLSGVTSAIQTQLDGKYGGSSTTNYIPLASGTHTLTNSFLSQSGSMITNSGSETVNGNFAVNGQMGVAYLTVGTGLMATSGLPSIAPVGGVISGAYTLTASGSSTSSAMKISTADFQSGVRYTITFSGCYGSIAGMSLYIFQATTAGTSAYIIADSGFYSIPTSSGTITATFVPQTNMSYLGTIYFRIDSSATGSAFNWSSFTVTESTVNMASILYNKGKYYAGANYGPPSSGLYGGNGDKIVLYPGGGGVYPYSQGIEGATMFFSVPTTAGYKWYVNGSSIATLGVSGFTAPVLTSVSDTYVGKDFYIAANSGAWNTTAGKGLYIRYSTNGGQDSTYIQSIDRSTLTLYPMIFYASSYGLYGGDVGIEKNITVGGDGTVSGILEVVGDLYCDRNILQAWMTDGGVTDITRNGSKGSNAYACKALQVSTDYSGGIGGCYWFMNNFNRTADGGALCATIRNDNGNMRVMAGSFGTTWNSSNGTTYTFGNVGPYSDGWEWRHTNGTQGIGLGYNTIYQCGSNANQELGLKAKGSAAIWMYSPIYMALSGALPISSSQSNYPIVYNASSGIMEQSMARYANAFYSNSYAWTGGTNMTYAFHKRTVNLTIAIFGNFSYYVSGGGKAYPYIRIYSQNSGVYQYYSLEQYFNVTYNHTNVPFCLVFTPSNLPWDGWYDIFIYNNGGCISDGNDILNVNIGLLPSFTW